MDGTDGAEGNGESVGGSAAAAPSLTIFAPSPFPSLVGFIAEVPSAELPWELGGLREVSSRSLRRGVGTTAIT